MTEYSYDLELERVISELRKEKPKRVCIQLPDGLKPRAPEIVDAMKKEFPKTEVFIWMGSNFGACDGPLGLEQIGVEMLIMWGHNRFVKIVEGWDV
jgi:2-(3-amino-3-carboxypropyl)histidine synthase